MYGYLIAVRENLKKYLNHLQPTSNLAACLANELTERMAMITKNPMMICAVFFDRRYSSELNRNEKELAIRSFVKIWEQIRLETAKNGDISENNKEFEFLDNTTVLEEYFCSKDVELMRPENKLPNCSMSNAELINILAHFDETIGRQHAKKNVIEFWEDQKYIFPELYLLSTIINAIPPTQASTERCFSTLDFIYNEKRTRLSLKLLEQILMIKLNKGLVESIFFQQLELIRQKKKKIVHDK